MGGLEQYESRVAQAEALTARGPDVITELLANSNFEWAAQNGRVTAEAYVDLGLLHWRRGVDPREDFECAARAYQKLNEIVQLVGRDSLSEDQKLTLEIANIIKGEFLQQNAFSDFDFTCPLEKVTSRISRPQA